MSLVQTYRLQLAAKQKRQLLFYLTLAIAVHAGVAVGLLWQAKQLLRSELKSAKPPIPLEFIDIAPTAKSTAPVQTERRAAVNSTAARQHNPALSVQSGKAATPTAAAPPQPPQPPQPSLSAPSQLPSQPVPRPVERPSRPSTASTERIPQAQPTPASGVARIPPRWTQPARSAANPATNPATNPVAPPASAPPAATSPPTAAAQLGGPVNRSLSEARGTNGSGISGELNANRVGTGVGVDAAQDDLWGGYLAALNRAVEQNWQRVAVAATRRTKIRFQVDRQGRLTDLKLVEPSGDDTADQAAIQAVRTAAPFAPLPQNASEDVLIVNFTFTQWLTPASP